MEAIEAKYGQLRIRFEAMKYENTKLTAKVVEKDILLDDTVELIELFVQEWNNTKRFLRIFTVLSFVSRLILKLTEKKDTIVGHR